MIVGQDKANLRVAALVPSPPAFAARSSPTSSFTSRSVLCALYAADGSQITGSRVRQSRLRVSRAPRPGESGDSGAHGESGIRRHA